jgi:hypothetical protein
MVEIGLEAVKGENLPKDLYVSLRVGEAQKFMKANCDRSYKFPPSTLGDRKYAKLEMFKRVGVCAIPVDTEKMQGTHEAAVVVDERLVDVPEKEVAYRVNVTGLSGSLDSPSKPAASDKGALLDRRVASAKAYLDTHQLEQRLAEAMMAVLRDRPEDPGKFIAEKLTSGAGMLKKVAEAAPGDLAELREQAREALVNSVDGGKLKDALLSAARPGTAEAKAEPAPALVAPTTAVPALVRPKCNPMLPVSLMVASSSLGIGPTGTPWMFF